jgi:glycogenin glucosyltransferase
METYLCLMKSLENPENRELVCKKFRWPEMQYATMIWSGEWTSIDIRFSGINGYPDLKVLCGVHYAGSKPWNVRDKKSLERVIKFPDYDLWYKKYLDMTEIKYDNLQKIPKLARLMHSIENSIHH